MPNERIVDDVSFFSLSENVEKINPRFGGCRLVVGKILTANVRAVSILVVVLGSCVIPFDIVTPKLLTN